MKPGDLLFSKQRFVLTDSSGWREILGDVDEGIFVVLLERPDDLDQISLVKIMTRDGKIGWCSFRYLQTIDCK